MMIYATRGIETRAQAFTAGGLSAVLSLLPSFLFHLSFLQEYPEVSVFKQMGQMFGLAKGVFCSSFSCYAACR